LQEARGIKISAPGFNGDVIIVVSAREYYAIAPADIVFDEGGASEFPRPIWVKREATVWRCQQTVLEGPGAKGVTGQELSSLHSNLSVQIQDLSARSDLLAARLGAPAAPAVQLVGSVAGGATMPAPLVIRRGVLLALNYPLQTPLPDTTDDSAAISSLRQGIDPIEDLAKNCMVTKPFSGDGLRADYASVEYMGTTLGGFVNYIEFCYRHPRS